MGFIYPNCDFGLDFKPHPELEKLKQDVNDWLIDTKLVDSSRISKYVYKSTYASFVFADCPYTERLVLLCRWLVLIWIADNELRDEIVPGERERKLHEEFVQLWRQDRTDSKSKLIQEFVTINNRIKELSDPDWYDVWSYTNYQCAKWQHEMVFESKTTKPDMATIMVGRIWDGLLFAVMLFHEFLDETYVPMRVRANPSYSALRAHAVKAGIFFNDFIAWEKELTEDNPYGIFRAVQAQKKLTNDQLQEVTYELHEIVMNAFDKFNVVADRIDELFVEEDREIMHTVVKHIRRFLQGNKDFHFTCPGYVSKDAIIKLD